jgi:hypothetical protein
MIEGIFWVRDQPDSRKKWENIGCATRDPRWLRGPVPGIAVGLAHATWGQRDSFPEETELAPFPPSFGEGAAAK